MLLQRLDIFSFTSCAWLFLNGDRQKENLSHCQNSLAGVWTRAQTASALRYILILDLSVLGMRMIAFPCHGFHTYTYPLKSAPVKDHCALFTVLPCVPLWYIATSALQRSNLQALALLASHTQTNMF